MPSVLLVICSPKVPFRSLLGMVNGYVFHIVTYLSIVSEVPVHMLFSLTLKVKLEPGWNFVK